MPMDGPSSLNDLLGMGAANNSAVATQAMSTPVMDMTQPEGNLLFSILY